MTLPENKPRLAALQYRDFRLVWSSQLFATFGKRMQAALILWHVYELTREPLALGLVGLANILPVILISLISGMAADILDRRKLMLLTQSSMVVLSLVLGWLTWQGLDSVWAIYAVSLIGAAGWTFEAPARQALIPSLVSREHLPNAFSLNSAVFQLGSILGPAAAGAMIARFNIALAYGINAASFLWVVLLLSLISSRPPHRGNRPAISLETAWEGFRFVRIHPIILPIMLLDFFASFFSSATILLPVFAQDILQVGAVGYGWLFAATSIGALLMAGLISLRSELKRQGPLLLWAVSIYGVATILFGASRSFALSFLALTLVGASDTVSTIIRQTIRNLQTPDHLRGRMTSLNMIFFRGGPELGELEAGFVASLFGAPFAVISGGIACLLMAGLVTWKSPRLRSYNGDEPELAPLPAR